MDIFLYPLFTAGCVILFFYCFRLFLESPFWGTAWVLFLVLALVYDNLILTFGHLIGFGDMLETLSLIRYLLHVLLIPTLVFVALDVLRRIQVSWIESVTSQVLFHIYTFVLTVIGVFHDLLWVHLEAITINGIDRYVISKYPFSIAYVLVLIPLFIASITVWRRLKWPILSFGFIVVLLLGCIAFLLENYAIGSFTELVFMFFLVLTEYRLKQEDYTSNLFEA